MKKERMMNRLGGFILAGLIAISANLYSAENSGGKWWESAVFYQIFPMSYMDTDADGYGDLKGIAQKLDYMADLGITAIWLNPINDRQDTFYHGYAVTDFYGIWPKLGTMADFELLVKEAHKRDIKIVLDLVMNHAALANPWFMDSATNAASKYADWFLWRKDNPGWPNAAGSTQQPAWNEYKTEGARKGQFYYAAFNFTIPDFNHTNPEVKKEFQKIAKFWLDKGADGFRIDGARYVIETGPDTEKDTSETIAYLNEFAKYVKSVNPNAYVIAEVFAGMDVAAKYYVEGGLDAVFSFDFGGKGATIQTTFAASKVEVFEKVMNQFINNVIKSGVAPVWFFSHFFSNHDSGRSTENLRDYDKIKSAAVIFFTLPGGAPYIYYGDEIGMREGLNNIGDSAMRNPMQWDSSLNAGFTTKKSAWTQGMKKFYMDPAKATTAAEKKEATNQNVVYQEKDAQSVLNLFKKVIALRKQYYKVFESGEYQQIKIDDKSMSFFEEEK